MNDEPFDPLAMILEEQEAQETWQMREMNRFRDGTYTRVPWANENWIADNNHFAHVSVEDSSKLAYTPHDEAGKADRQLSVRPGKYLMKHYHDCLGGKDIERLVAGWKGTFQSELQVTMDPDKIEEIYRYGPSSCMSGTECFTSLPQHPAYVYGAGDLGIAYFLDSHGDYGGRTLCWPERKVYCAAMYGDYETLTFLLKSENYQEGSRADFDGARLLKMHFEPDDDLRRTAFIMPYLDIGYQVYDNGQCWVVSESPPEGHHAYPAQFTSGQFGLTTCAHCACELSTGEANFINHDYHCRSCVDRFFEYCAWNGHYVLGTDMCLMYDGTRRCRTCIDDVLLECTVCSVYYDPRNILVGVCTTCRNEETIVDEMADNFIRSTMEGVTYRVDTA